MRVGRLMVVVLAALVWYGAGGVRAQDGGEAPDSLPPLAAVTEGNIWLHGLLPEPVPATAFEAGDQAVFLDLAWSPDGCTLVFVQVVGNDRPALAMANRENTVKATLAADLNWAGMPLDFTPDGSQVIYGTSNPDAQPAPDANAPSQQQIDVYAMEPSDEGEPELIGSFVIESGCEGRISYPMDARYYEETGLSGNRPLLGMTPYGLAHSTNCLGEGIALLNVDTGEDTVLDETLMRARLSPDRSRVLGIREGRLAIVDLETGEITEVETAVEPDQVAWGAAGSSTVFYSTRADMDQAVELSAEEAQFLAETGLVGDTPIPQYTVSIRRANLDDGSDLELYANEAWAIGQMIATPDGQAVLFSQIPNLGTWVESLAQEEIDPADTRAIFASVPTALYRLDLEAIGVALLGEDLRQAALNAAAYSEQASG